MLVVGRRAGRAVRAGRAAGRRARPPAGRIESTILLQSCIFARRAKRHPKERNKRKCGRHRSSQQRPRAVCSGSASLPWSEAHTRPLAPASCLLDGLMFRPGGGVRLPRLLLAPLAAVPVGVALPAAKPRRAGNSHFLHAREQIRRKPMTAGKRAISGRGAPSCARRGGRGGWPASLSHSPTRLLKYCRKFSHVGSSGCAISARMYRACDCAVMRERAGRRALESVDAPRQAGGGQPGSGQDVVPC